MKINEIFREFSRIIFKPFPEYASNVRKEVVEAVAHQLDADSELIEICNSPEFSSF
jgi:hypothetical protein